MSKLGILQARARASHTYKAKAVHFDGNTFMVSGSALGAVDGPRGILSYWGKQAAVSQFAQSGNFQVLNNGNFNCYLSGPGGWDAVLGGNPVDTNVPGIAFYDAANANFINWDSSNTDMFGVDVWFHVLMSWDTNYSNGNRRAVTYVNDVQVPFDLKEGTNRDHGPDPFSVGYQVPPFFICGSPAGQEEADAGGILGDMADLYFNTTDTIVEADLTILEANRRKFISAALKPVDPTTFPTGILLCSGDATGFVQNQGNGTNDLVLTGTLTNVTTSPSD